MTPPRDGKLVRIHGALACLALLLILGGCATTPTPIVTPYQPKGWYGGYYDRPLGVGHYFVEFAGNRYTSREMVEDFLLYRCAELAVDAGYTYFRMSDQSLKSYKPDWVAGTQIRLFSGPPPAGDPDVHDAQEVLRRLERQVMGSEASPAEASKAIKAAEEDSQRGRYAEATAQYRRALWIRERALGPQDPDTAKSRRDLAEALFVEGRYVPAERQLRLALAALERALGLGHTDTAETVYSLGLALWALGEYAPAEAQYRRALPAMENDRGFTDPRTAARLMNGLGLALAGQGKFAEAEAQCRRAVVLLEKAAGPEHPYTLYTLLCVGGVLERRGDLPEAERYQRRVLAGLQKVFGPQSGEAAWGMYQLGNVLLRKGAFGEANGLFRSSLDIHFKRYSVHNPLVSFPRTGFAQSQLGLRLLDSAAKAGEVALKNREATLGPSHPDTAETLFVLGQIAEAQNRREPAKLFYERAFSIRRERLGPAHPDTVASRAALERLQ